jgi:hypothetical protein
MLMTPASSFSFVRIQYPMRGASQSRKIALERFDCARWRYQASMKLTAPRNSRQKFRSAPSGWCFKNLTHLILSG